MIFSRDILWDDCYVSLSNNDVIIWGAGRALNTLCDLLRRINEKILFNIRYIVDNCQEKWGKILSIRDNNIEIISPFKMRAVYKENKYILIIATQYLEPILNQVSGYSELDDLKIFFYDDLKVLKCTKDFYLPNSLHRSNTKLIPKIIHYCWFGKKEIPEQYKIWIKSWKKYCPDYEVIEWNENNYDYTKNQYTYEAYKSGKWSFVSDYARLDIIYNNGGIYLDTDVELVKNLDELLFQKGFMGLQDDYKCATGLGFGAIKYHPLIKSLMDDYKNRKFKKDDGQFDLTICPDIQTTTLVKMGMKKENKYQIIKDMTILPAPILGGYIGSDLMVDDFVFAIHHFAGSWNENNAERDVWEKRIRRKNMFNNRSLKKC